MANSYNHFTVQNQKKQSVPFIEINQAVSVPVTKDPLRYYVVKVRPEHIPLFIQSLIKIGWKCYPYSPY